MHGKKGKVKGGSGGWLVGADLARPDFNP
ncbi:hypothetical protein DFA_05994 [Cavenderia fasciculata]|uniref:Uncharacterized protein n=1 Tax=Cavenderia fasciculata TaxID=261658 RepID=F4PJT4_CACFS|nr:hypothetical protein DFA_05994 [Cavenderia fasciculata]EGG23858.1 hypothetical protein DFA_05994 [Cavenderia fasciculata]|eukprot:XP_004361709.1 hypothetical protein DFA_05994 [Cavenderia fasciculata]